MCRKAQDCVTLLISDGIKGLTAHRRSILGGQLPAVNDWQNQQLSDMVAKTFLGGGHLNLDGLAPHENR
jgi:hypothetical protein